MVRGVVPSSELIGNILGLAAKSIEEIIGRHYKCASGDSKFISIVGPNGSGKSHCLRDILTDYMGAANKGKPPWCRSIHLLMGIASSVNDPFVAKRAVESGYAYLGLRTAANQIRVGGLERNLARSILLTAGNANTRRLLGRVQEITGIDIPAVVIDGYKVGESEVDLFNLVIPDDSEYAGGLNRLAINFVRCFENNWYSATFDKGEPIVLSLDGWRRLESIFDEANEFFGYTHERFLAYVENYFSLKFNSVYNIGPAFFSGGATPSWGQLIFQSTLIRILSFLDGNCLILIDEPETALHPGWQSNYISALRGLLSDAGGAHVVVLATHSPFLVGDSDEVYRVGDKGRWIELVNSHRALDLESLVRSCFDARVFSEKKIDASIRILLNWISANDSLNSSSEVEFAYTQLKTLKGKGSITLDAVLDDYESLKDGVRN